MEDPPGFAPHQWLKFKKDMRSDKAKKQSKKGKEARAMQTHMHTTGTKSYAQLQDEYIVKEKEDPGPIKFFDLTHRRKDGSYVKEKSKHFMTAAATEREKLKATKAYDDEKEVEGDVWHNLTGDEMPGRARGYGIGATKSQVTGFCAHVKRMRNEGASYIDPATQIQKLQAIVAQQEAVVAQQQAMVAQQQKMMAKTNEEVANLRDEVQIYRTSLGAFSRDMTFFPSTQGAHIYGLQNANSNRAGEPNSSSPNGRLGISEQGQHPT